MHKAEDIEDILGRLMPVAVSEAAGREMEDAIDALAREAGYPEEAPVVRVRWPWWGAAAAVAVLSAMLFWNQGPDAPAVADVSATAEQATGGLVTVSQSESLESVVEEGWQDDGTGNAHQALRLQLVKRHQVLDGETGILMTVSEPREEVLLVPVNAF